MSSKGNSPSGRLVSTPARPPLSEKAKGKQRAVEPEPDADAVDLSHRNVLIRFSEGVPDLLLAVVPADTCKDIKKEIRAQRQALQRRRLRLIAAGRILPDSTDIYAWLRAREDADDGARVQPRPPPWLQCAIGAQLERASDEDAFGEQAAQLRPLRGFDRLAAAGFSAVDIAGIREQFHAAAPVGDTGGSVLNEEQREEEAWALEEQWIESLDGRGGQSGEATAAATIAQGLVVGFFFPILPFFFMREPRAPAFWRGESGEGESVDRATSVVFSRRMQMALCIGFILNLFFGAWRYLAS